MVQQLSQLRYSADLDTSSYVRGMAAKVQADRAGAESAKAAGAEMGRLAAQSEATSTTMMRLGRSLIPGFSGGAKFVADIKAIGEALNRGAMKAEEAGVLIQGAYQKVGLMADAAQLAKKGYVDLAPIVSSLNAELEHQAAAAKAAAEALRGLSTETVAKLKSEQAGSSFRAETESLLGIGKKPATADGAGYSALDEEAKRLEQLARLRAEAIGAAWRDGLNDSFRFDRKSVDFGATYQALDEEMKRLEQLAKARAEAMAAATQAAIADAFGYGSGSRPATADGAGYGALDQLAKDLKEKEDQFVATQKLRAEAMASATQAAIADAFGYGSASRPATADGAGYGALDQLAKQMEENGREMAARAKVIGQAIQEAWVAGINERVGIRAPATEGGASWQALDALGKQQEEAAKSAADYAVRAERLAGSLDPAYAAQQRLNAALLEADDLYTADAISAARYQAARAAANAEFSEFHSARDMAASFGAMDEAARDMRDLTMEADRLKAELDPVNAAFDEMLRKLDRIGQMGQRGLLGPGQQGAAIGQLQGQFAESQVMSAIPAGAYEEAHKLNAELRAIDQALKPLRAAYDPVANATEVLAERQNLYNNALAKGRMELPEHTKAMANAQKQFDVVADTVKRTGNNVSLTTHQFTNLGYQLNDVITMGLSGASMFQVVATQGGQVLQILQSGQGGIAGAFKDIGNAITTFFTPARIAMGAVAAGVGLLGASMLSASAAHYQFERAISGVGQASGVTSRQLETMATQVAKSQTVAVSAARATLDALARSGADLSPGQFGQIANLSRPLQRQTGREAADINQLLADSFRDPVRGAERLNEVLGGLGYTTRRYIEDVRASRGEHAANQALIDSIVPRIRTAAETTTLWARAWDAVYSASSRFFTALATVGSNELSPAQRQLAATQGLLSAAQDRLRSANAQNFMGLNSSEVELATSRVGQLTQRLRELTEQQEAAGRTQATESTRVLLDRRRSTALQEAAQDAPQADAERIRDVANRYRVAEQYLRDYREERDRLFRDEGVVESPADRRYEMGLQRAQEARRAALQSMLNDGQRITEVNSDELRSNQELVASRQTRVDLMERETRIANMEATARETNNVQLAEEAAALRRANDQRERGPAAGTPAERTAELTEDARRRENERQARTAGLVVQQTRTREEGVRTLEAENAAIGQSVYQQTLLTERTRLTNEATREYRQIWGETAVLPDTMVAGIDRAAERIARLRSSGAGLRLQDQMQFDRRTIGLTEEDVKIAQQLRDIYGRDIPGAMASSEAAYMRLTNTVRTTQDAFRDAFSGFFRDIATGTNAVEALRNATSRLAGQFAEMAAKQLFNMAFGGFFQGMAGSKGGLGGGLGGILGGLLSGFGGGGGGAAAASVGAHLHLHGGGVVGKSGGYYGGAYSSSLWDHAPRYQGGAIRSDEIAAILHRNETVLTAEQSERAARMAAIGQTVIAGSPHSGKSVVFAPTLNVNMPEGGTPEQGNQYGAAMMNTIQGMFRNFLAEEMRTGGTLNPV